MNTNTKLKCVNEEPFTIQHHRMCGSIILEAFETHIRDGGQQNVLITPAMIRSYYSTIARNFLINENYPALDDGTNHALKLYNEVTRTLMDYCVCDNTSMAIEDPIYCEAIYNRLYVAHTGGGCDYVTKNLPNCKVSMVLSSAVALDSAPETLDEPSIVSIYTGHGTSESDDDEPWLQWDETNLGLYFPTARAAMECMGLADKNMDMYFGRPFTQPASQSAAQQLTDTNLNEERN